MHSAAKAVACGVDNKENQTRVLLQCLQDGLLLDTETFYTIAQQQILAKLGREFSWDLKAKMMGKKALDAAQVRNAYYQAHAMHSAVVTASRLVCHDCIWELQHARACLLVEGAQASTFKVCLPSAVRVLQDRLVTSAADGISWITHTNEHSTPYCHCFPI